jgi:glycosyltransferase involved in cell wall biosynthesis
MRAGYRPEQKRIFVSGAEKIRAEILLDVGTLRANLYGGVGQVAAQYARHLAAAQSGDFDFRLLLHPGANAAIFPQSLPVARTRRPFANRVVRLFNPAHPRRLLYRACGHRLRHALRYQASIPEAHDSAPLVVTVHDAIPLGDFRPEKAAIFASEMRAAIARADALVFISRHARDAVAGRFDLTGKATRVIYNGVDAPQENPRKPEWLDERAPFFLAMGRIVAHKNIHLLAAMMAHFPQHQLVAAGASLRDGAYLRKVRAAAAKAGAAERIIIPGKIGEGEKAYLYSACAALLMPSRDEGFGMPVIEALHCGKPVFCAHRASLPEVGGDCAFYWDDLTPSAMAALVREKMASPDLNSESEISRRKQRAARFSWDASARAYFDLYKEIPAKK